MADHLIQLITLVDRPNHNQMVLRAKRANMLSKLVIPFAAAIVAYVGCQIAFHFGGVADLREKSINYALLIGMVTGGILLLEAKAIPIAERHNQSISGVIAVLSLFASLGFALSNPAWMHENWFSNEWPGLIAIAAIGFFGAYIASVIALSTIKTAIYFFLALIHAFSSPIAVPIQAAIAYFNNRAVKNEQWTTSKGTPIIVFGLNGVKTVNNDGEPIFVASPSLRRGGAARKAGIPLLTRAQISDPTLVSQVIANHNSNTPTHQPTKLIHENNNMLSQNQIAINPASGFPMINGIESVDLAGNTYGTNISQSQNNTE